MISATLLVGISCNSNVKKSYHENGKLSSVLRYEDGVLHGLSEWYFANGNPMMRTHYNRGKLHGKQERFYENGVLQSVSWYKEDQLDSLMQHYSIAGRLVLEEYYRNDVLHGPYRRYYDDGALFAEGAYHEGMMDGSWLYYSPDGMIIGKGEFKMGAGVQKAWHPNGQTHRIITYKDNLKHGPEEHYDPQGRLILRRIYESGIMVSEEKTE
ncbi:MAG: toxin-antitoxin system YwqK family antitoxin [Bacteroidetes bacterium]|nr:toxin-antitoxin system YwqK family antitoxin [Bacteroidota bacterium]